MVIKRSVHNLVLILPSKNNQTSTSIILTDGRECIVLFYILTGCYCDLETINENKIVTENCGSVLMEETHGTTAL